MKKISGVILTHENLTIPVHRKFIFVFVKGV